MMLRHAIRRMLTGLTAATVVAAGTVAASATPALAVTAKLEILLQCQTNDGRYWDYTVRVSGVTSRTYYDKYSVEVRIWGDDEWSDDLLSGPHRTYYEPEAGGYYSFAICMNSSTLNEDIGQDDIYAGVRVYNVKGVNTETAESNRWYGYF
ncbi:hypothetical protein GCE86_14655 [Micromonospora terminaliae]|uniref:Secreted protein n=1 Tax=Micromonospora terminaliae TaxID=1914461 RepID=A0AAJ2ZBC2_9ACTN|nr:hypothetical protein [Micromonospora terminaliae]NES27072.1 hypothetical protein [Micromonospora terminaliae]QGL48157.1 hypothetical protein GCE86_14655 [Micromonospora terminaliae]